MAGSVRQDNGSWYYVLETKVNGNRKQVKKRGFRTKREAQRALTEAENAVNQGTYVQPSKTKYNAFLNEWLQSKSITLRKVTLNSYQRLINNHIAPILGDKEIEKITTRDIELMYLALVEKGLSSRTVLDIHKVTKSSLATAQTRRYISHNPADNAETPRARRREMQVWSLEQSSKFLKEAGNDRLYIAFVLALSTGMRQSEILALRWRDMDFENKTVQVVQTLSHDGKEIIAETKTHSSSRTIALPDYAVTQLAKHRRMVLQEKMMLGSQYQDYDLIVCTSLGTPINPRNLLRTFYTLINRASVPQIRFHDLRHTVATLMLEENVNPKIVKEILGHSDIRITLDTYSHVLPSTHKKTAEKFGLRLFGQPSM